MKEIFATFTKKKTCLDNRQLNRIKVKRIIRKMYENFVRGTFPKRTKRAKRRNLATSRVLQSFTDTGGILHPDKILFVLRFQ